MHKHTLLKIGFIFIFSIFESCGAGTTGKIKSYEYNIPKEKLDIQLKAYYRLHPILKYADNLKQYNLEGTGYESYMFNCYLKVPEGDFVYTLSFIGDSTYWATNKNSELAIVNAGKFRDNSKINSELGFFEKRHLVKIFEENFIDKLPIRPISNEDRRKKTFGY